MLKLFKRTLALSGVLFALQVSLHALLPGRDVPSPILLCEQYLEEGRDIFYFGDSTLYRGDPKDTDARTVPELFEDGLEGVSIGTIAHDAYSPVLYNAFIHYLADRPGRPKGVVIPIHLRSFSVEREQRPESQFVREQYFLRHDRLVPRAFFRPFAALRIVDLTPIRSDAHLRMDVRDGEKSLGTVGDLLPQPGETLEGEVLEDFIRLCYFYRLTPEHRQLKALRALVETCIASDIVPMVYITPIDVELGNELLGEEFAARVAENSAVIEALMSKYQVPFFNFSGSFAHDNFVYDHFPDGYLNHGGKRNLAERLIRTSRLME